MLPGHADNLLDIIQTSGIVFMSIVLAYVVHRLEKAFEVVRAHLVAAWHALNDLSDEGWDAVADDLADEIWALRMVCNHEDPSIDH